MTLDDVVADGEPQSQAAIGLRGDVARAEVGSRYWRAWRKAVGATGSEAWWSETAQPGVGARSLQPVVHVLFFSDRQVRDKLFALVDGTRGLLLVKGVRHGKDMRPPQEREPFDTLEARFGHVLTQVLVADEGSIEGMWRDPLGDLAERLYPRSREQAYTAASHYLLIENGRPRAVVRKRETPREELWFLQEALSQLSAHIPAPAPARKPDPRRTPAPKASRHPPPSTEATPPRGTPARAVPEPAGEDPWKMLGIAPGTSKEEARRAFRTLVAQYHPDKVAHLAPEFQELAERKTRALLEAWERLEKELA